MHHRDGRPAGRFGHISWLGVFGLREPASRRHRTEEVVRLFRRRGAPGQAGADSGFRTARASSRRTRGSRYRRTASESLRSCQPRCTASSPSQGSAVATSSQPATSAVRRSSGPASFAGRAVDPHVGHLRAPKARVGVELFELGCVQQPWGSSATVGTGVHRLAARCIVARGSGNPCASPAWDLVV